MQTENRATRLFFRLASFSVGIGFGWAAHAMPVELNAGPKEIYRTQCSECHGTNGVSHVPHYPNLAGQKKDYLLKAMGDYKAGKRDDIIMQRTMEDLNDEEIETLATYVSTMLTCKPKPATR
jgi:cytochrome c553